LNTLSLSLSLSPYTTIPGTGDVLILLIGHPVYHRGKGGGGREIGGEVGRDAPVCVCVHSSSLFLSSLFGFFFSVGIRNDDAENVKKKMAAVDRKILVCVCVYMCKNEREEELVWFAMERERKKKEDQSNKQSPWLDKGGKCEDKRQAS
jgi:hypothetical protein